VAPSHPAACLSEYESVGRTRPYTRMSPPPSGRAKPWTRLVRPVLATLSSPLVHLLLARGIRHDLACACLVEAWPPLYR
jgi:hypothetical protein